MCFFIKKLINFVKKINFQKIVKKLEMFSQMLNIYFFNNVHTSNVLVEFDFEPVKK